MRRVMAGLLMLMMPMLAHADVTEVVRNHVLPGYARFSEATARLAVEAEGSCAPDDLAQPFHAAFDAWMDVQHLHLGPVEEEGRGLAIAFWPDPKLLGLKAQRSLIGGDPRKLEPSAFADQSVAARGFPGLERLLWPAEPWGSDPCPLIRATAQDLARLAAEVEAGWQDGYADLVLTAGQVGNDRFLSREEARQAMFTIVVTGLEQLRDHRIGRPLGTFDRPAPDRAEARASGRSLRNVSLSLAALHAMVRQMTDGAPDTLAALGAAMSVADGMDDPVFAGVATPEGRLKVEILQQAVDRAHQAALQELGPALGVGLGFNAADGD